MGWRERDWAKLTDSELAALYGVRRQTAVAAAEPPESTPHAVSLRTFVWGAIGALTLGTAAFAYTQMPRDRMQGPGITPSSIHGTTLAPGNPFGPGAVCTEMEYVTPSGWQCDLVDMNVAHVPVIQATPYNGQCGHLKVVDARWACIDPMPTGTSS